MKKITTTFVAIILGFGVFAQALQLRPEVVELYRLQDIAMRSRVLNSDDFIEKHKAFFNHPLFCENAFGFEYLNFAKALLIRNEHAMAEKYFLKSATRLRYVSTSNALEWVFRVRPWPDNVYLIPRTVENMRFRETMLEKILEIEKQAVDSRIVAIAQEISEMVERDQAVRLEMPRRPDGQACFKAMLKVDSANIFRIIELIKENPDIDIMRINRSGRTSRSFGRDFGLGDIDIILWHQRGDAFGTLANFFLPYFRERAEAGRGLDYTFWYDTYRFHTKRESSYFGIVGSGMTRRPFVLYVDNLDEINENRARVGLLPLTRR